MEEAVFVTFRAPLECFMGLGMQLAVSGFHPQNHKIQSTFPADRTEKAHYLLEYLLRDGVYLSNAEAKIPQRKRGSKR